ncbi:hypothetical protein Tco_0674318 [Tanacetum coccineum]
MSKVSLRECQELQRNICARAKLIIDLKNMSTFVAAVKGTTFLGEAQDWDLEKAAKIMQIITELYSHVFTGFLLVWFPKTPVLVYSPLNRNFLSPGTTVTLLRSATFGGVDISGTSMLAATGDS